MGEVVHRCRMRIEQRKRPLRVAHLEGVQEPIRLGLHSGVKHLYAVPFEEELPTTLDHIVAGVAG
jgi:hypothetical protein